MFNIKASYVRHKKALMSGHLNLIARRGMCALCRMKNCLQ